MFHTLLVRLLLKSVAQAQDLCFAEVVPWSNGVPTWGMGMGMRSVPNFAPLTAISPQNQNMRMLVYIF